MKPSDTKRRCLSFTAVSSMPLLSLPRTKRTFVPRRSWRRQCLQHALLLLVALSSILFFLGGPAVAVTAAETTDDNQPPNDEHDKNQFHYNRLQHAKLNLWSRGAYDLDVASLMTIQEAADYMQAEVAMAPWKLGPIKQARKGGASQDPQSIRYELRGGGDSSQDLIERLSDELGPEFVQALERNQKEHEEDCLESCRYYYCADPDNDDDEDNADVLQTMQIHSYSMGAVPPEDFSADFGFPLDLIKVVTTLGDNEEGGLFTRQEARSVIDMAIAEGVDRNVFPSGKYQLGGDWLTNLPQARAWFNKLAKTTLFPLIARLFPTIVHSPAVLRAHSVSLLKYNATHARTDVHIDDGILALTLAMTPLEEYEGGGTYFEHFLGGGKGNNLHDIACSKIRDGVLAMDVGHGTFRPGSIRHGGHRVTSGTRYILGAFLLITDRVEHVRRLKNRGSSLRRINDLQGAEQHFQWALALNPKCTTCLKDWTEVLFFKKDFVSAEVRIREALNLLEQKDSDALFTLGLILSEQGRDDESIAAYRQSLELNAEDPELLYNLGSKLGSKGDVQEEIKMYDACTRVDPTFARAWLNWGTSLAILGQLDHAESKFLRSMECGKPEVTPCKKVLETR